MKDGDGWIVERDPEFDDMDRALVVAYRKLEAETTANGFKAYEEISPLADPDNPDAQFEFVALEPHINYVARARERALRQVREQFKEAPEQLDGLFIPVVKRQF